VKILLAVDMSPIACETIAAVQRVFGPTGASVVVLSVIATNDPETVPNPSMLSSVAQNLSVLEAVQVETHEELVANAVRTLRGAGLDASGEVAYGDPSHAIVEAARSHAADLVVLGSHGRSAVRRLVMGSVATHVVHHAPCDVLVVRHRHEERERERTA